MTDYTKDLLFRLRSHAYELRNYVSVEAMCAEIPFENGCIENENDRKAWGELTDIGLIVEMNAGLEVTRKGMDFES